MNEFDETFAIAGRGRKKPSRVRPWVILVTPLAAILFQVYAPLYAPLLHHLELPLLVAIYLALSRRSLSAGAVTGALIGLIQDALSHLPIGILGMVKTLVGYGAASVGVRLEASHVAVRFGLCTVLFLVHQLLYATLRRVLLGTPTGLGIPQMLLAAPANGLAGILLFQLLDKLRDREE
ncbi:MAG: rod shape-determining protein MreD [Bryobacteraceae bacterium]